MGVYRKNQRNDHKIPRRNIRMVFFNMRKGSGYRMRMYGLHQKVTNRSFFLSCILLARYHSFH
jgi:hypothetical protein